MIENKLRYHGDNWLHNLPLYWWENVWLLYHFDINVKEALNLMIWVKVYEVKNKLKRKNGK